MPTVSVIIPTHNRKDALLRNLNALQTQSFPLQDFEVIVVADGCSDGTFEELKTYKAPFLLKVIQQSGKGAASARNYGAENANGELLIFIDDDIEASPQLVEAHVTAHSYESNRVAIGYLPPILNSQKGFFRMKLREWWENMFYTMNQQGHRFNFRNLLSGNFSLSSNLFNQVGGFNVDFKCQEDYELGLRLIKAGASFIYVPQAQGFHHEITDLKRSLQRKYQEGKAAVQFIDTYPEVIYMLPIVKNLKGKSQFNKGLIYYAFNWPIVSGFLAVNLRYSLIMLEWLKMRRRWQQVLDKLLAYWYLRGIADTVGSSKELITKLNKKPSYLEKPKSLLEFDIIEGVEAAEQKLDNLQPDSIRCYYNKQPIGYLAPKHGFEHLKGRHLRAILANEFADTLMWAIVMNSGNNQYFSPVLDKHLDKEEVIEV